MKKRLPFLILFACFSLSAKETPTLFGRNDQMQIAVNNRILSVVNGKPITVIDVMKKMDMHFLQQFPQYASSPNARMQYYKTNWRAVLQELVEKELILADAEEAKLSVTGSEVREELERLFGPNTIEKLDQIDLSIDEAKQIIHDDLIIRRMTYYRINMKASKYVTPKDVKQAYEEFAKENIRPDRFRYQMITVRGKEATDNAQIANYLYQLLAEEKVATEDLKKEMEAHGYYREGVSFNISQVFDQTSKEIPEGNLTLLGSMENGAFSKPVAQRSRADQTMVFRIFCLEESIPGGPVPYAEAAPEIEKMLIDKKVEVERDKYFSRLRKRYGIPDNHIAEMVPEDFQPFSQQ